MDASNLVLTALSSVAAVSVALKLLLIELQPLISLLKRRRKTTTLKLQKADGTTVTLKLDPKEEKSVSAFLDKLIKPARRRDNGG